MMGTQLFVTKHGVRSVLNDDLVERVNENRWFTKRLLCDEFAQRAVQQRLSSLAASFFEEGYRPGVSNLYG
ncbi:hypothetical protein TNCV_405381 [Trichonephila clavipes]|nr:hypothetical protein TNCV_405381 [Trichonephila clavipes]